MPQGLFSPPCGQRWSRHHPSKVPTVAKPRRAFSPVDMHSARRLSARKLVFAPIGRGGVRNSSTGGPDKPDASIANPATAEIFWSNPKGNLSRVPDQVIYSLPPPMRAPYPETWEERRWKVIKSWLPAVLSGVACVAWAMTSSSRGPAQDFNAVPEFLQRAMSQGKPLAAAATTPANTTQAPPPPPGK